jgi:quercetin dioxygenase-like cupin family protein
MTLSRSQWNDLNETINWRRKIKMLTKTVAHFANAKSADSAEPVQVVCTDQIAPINYEWGSIKWVSDMNVTPGSQQSIGYAYVLPGATNPEHRHTSCQEVIYMLAGELKLFAHGEWQTLRPGQTALIPQGVRHVVVNEGWEPAVYLAAFSKAVRDTIFTGQTGKLRFKNDEIY